MKSRKTIKNKKKRGGNGEMPLNDDSLIYNLKEILNERPLKYKFDIKKQKSYGVDSFEVYIENNDKEISKYNVDNEFCVVFSIVHFPEGFYIFINTIFKCAPISNYGIFILDSFKEFARKFGYYGILIGSDGSSLEFYVDNNGVKEIIDINLAELSILSTGESWYNRMGFYTPINKEQIQDNLYKIGKNIQDLDNEDIIGFIDKTLSKYRGAREKYLPDCFKSINSYGKFHELYDFILNLTDKKGSDSIQEVFQEINNIIKNNCNSLTKICSLDYETMKKIICFINFVYKLLDIKYNATSLVYIVPKKGGYKKKVKNKNSRKRRSKII